MSSYSGTTYMDSIATYAHDYNSPQPPSPRRDSAVSTTKSTMHRTHDSRSSSRSSRKQPSYDRTVRTPGPRRIHSAPYGQLPQANLDAAIALHQRSCALFRTSSTAGYPTTASYTSTAAYPSNAAYPSATAYPASPLSTSPPREEYQSQYSVMGSPDTWVEDLDMIEEKFTLDEEDAAAPPTTEIRWTSDETRRREYAEIDRAQSGLKGMLRRIFPKIKSSKSRFYSEEDGSDAGSVRRYRLDIDGGDKDY